MDAMMNGLKLLMAFKDFFFIVAESILLSGSSLC